MMEKRRPLLPERYPNADLFICDFLDAVPKGDIGSMEHPLFSLSTKPDLEERSYKNGDKWIKVTPSTRGLATVHDRDILIYCISQCMAALNAGEKVSRKLGINVYDLLRATNRQDSGKGNDHLFAALERLDGTRITTNITQGGDRHTKRFGLIEGFDAISKTKSGRIQKLEITLSDWVFDALENNHVLTLNRKYFQLRKPIERRLYELARKHCGNQNKWEIRLDRLQTKCGSVSSMKEFRRMVRDVIKMDLTENHLPDYKFELSDDIICVRPKASRKLDGPMLPPLQSDTYEAAREYAAGWDVRQLESEWREWVQSKRILVKDSDAHFIKFCKKRGPYKQEALF